MKDLFEGFEVELDKLDPLVQSKALELAKLLMAHGGYEELTALKEAIKEAEQLFYDMEG